MKSSDNATTMLVREFERALRMAQEEELGRMRNTLYGLELLRDGMRALNAELRELRRQDAAAAAHYPAAPNR
jgi:hypothetical protein